MTFKYRLYPNKAQVEFLNSQLREACELYNAALQERRDAWKICRKSISYYDQCSQIKPMRDDGCLAIVNSTCSRHVLRRVDKTFKDFFSRVKRGEKPGYPRFKSWRRYNSIRLTHGDGCKLLDNGKLRIQGAGQVTIKLHRPVAGAINTATIKRQADRWFVCFNLECSNTKTLPTNNHEVGVDLGLTNFVTLSDGTSIKSPKYYWKAQTKLRITSRKVARRKLGSNRRRKAVRLLQRAHAYVENQRADFHHKLAYALVDAYGLIAVEDLGLKGLTRGIHSKFINDAGWAGFLDKLAYKAESAGRKLIKVDPRGTSQTCICGASVPKTLKVRWHSCSACGLSANRDHVAARLILSRGRNGPSEANVEKVISCVF